MFGEEERNLTSQGDLNEAITFLYDDYFFYHLVVKASTLKKDDASIMGKQIVSNIKQEKYILNHGQGWSLYGFLAAVFRWEPQKVVHLMR
ncbi:hypothetical protein DO021_04710 [Desulfobacter hydrogenophilus]|uniref:Uncharacterized protein n=1 Tax=Desulfobacter hydrogenophilus TaxID=2291 RepID=A0A328FEU4_9BACT|nr:hypothetical protein [Desulfobacter hydrogenophilus]NDY70848.1 hypothetical protein [Desulfobacter hydrogenophilus]QBH11619.1 hypothetical protein EYB58_00975 [Desulfobacter hydrogenophilus]RAM03164.1 hypothetical protein DO021_04710 [Desulfobacter hydrogenophilus]